MKCWAYVAAIAWGAICGALLHDVLAVIGFATLSPVLLWIGLRAAPRAHIHDESGCGNFR